MSNVITSIDRRSPAERAGVRTGEKLISIGGRGVEDVLDYRFFSYDRDPLLVLEGPDGQRRSLRVEKEEAEELGLNFETYLMDQPRPCSNHCLFCFVDQMAPGCRDTLYFKDDDARLSFLMGNYITLTNLTPREAQRIIDLRISPINVSVHATDPKLRAALLGSRAGGGEPGVHARLRQGGHCHERPDCPVSRVQRRPPAPADHGGYGRLGVRQLLHCARGPDQVPGGAGQAAARGPGHRESDH